MVTTGAIAKVLPYMRATVATAARGSVTSWCPLACPHRAAGLLAGGPSGASRLSQDRAERLALSACLGSCGYGHANCGRLARLHGEH